MEIDHILLDLFSFSFSFFSKLLLRANNAVIDYLRTYENQFKESYVNETTMTFTEKKTLCELIYVWS